MSIVAVAREVRDLYYHDMIELAEVFSNWNPISTQEMASFISVWADDTIREAEDTND